MAAPTIFTESEQSFPKELNQSGVDYMIVELAAAALQGVPAVTRDIGLWFRDLGDSKFGQALKRVGGLYFLPTASTPPMSGGKNVVLFDIVLNMHGLRSCDHEIRGGA